jgi:histone H4
MPGKGKRLSSVQPPRSQRLRAATSQDGGGVRHSKDKSNLSFAISGITKPAVRRLARRGGVKRVSGQVYFDTRLLMKDYLTKVLNDSNLYADNAQRKTIGVRDILAALRRRNECFYGYGTWSEKTGSAVVKPPDKTGGTSVKSNKRKKHRHSITGFDRKSLASSEK